MNLDDPKITIKRAEIIKRKTLLKNFYLQSYHTFKKLSQNTPKGKKVELGSGGGFIKEIIPDCITSDVMQLPSCDLTFPAEKLPFKNNSVSAIYILNTFHHIKNPKKALFEFQRCLKRKGVVIMIEPNNSILGKFIYKNFHHETFDPNSNWITAGKGHLSSANGALPWIIFKRDKDIYEKLFTNLKIVKLVPHTPFLYLLSGGFTAPQLIPVFLYPFVTAIENIIKPLNNQMGMFITIVLRKIK